MSRLNSSDALSRPAFLVETIAVFCLMCSFGFPGNLTSVFGGETIGMIISYGASLLEIVVMLMTSGDTFLDIKLIDLKKKYAAVYLMLAVLFVLSMLISQNRIKQLTIIIRFSITAFFGLWLADRFDSEHLLELVYLAQVGVLLANFLTFTAFPAAGYYVDEGYGYIFRGLYTQKNGLGLEMAWGIVMQIELLRVKRRRKHPLFRFFWGVLGAQIFFLIYSQATSARFACLLPILYLIYYDRRGGRTHRFQWGIVYTVATVGALFLCLTVVTLMAPLLEYIGKDATLSNRVPMWQGIIAFMQEYHTFTGFGLLQFWETPSALKILNDSFPNNSWYRSMAFGAHNELLEMWLDIGLLGIATVFAATIYCFYHVRRLTSEQYTLCSIIMIPILVSGVTERMFSNVNYHTLFFFVMLGTACSWPRQGGTSPGEDTASEVQPT